MTHKVTYHKPQLPQSVTSMLLVVCVNVISPLFSLLHRSVCVFKGWAHKVRSSLCMSINLKITACVSHPIFGILSASGHSNAILLQQQQQQQWGRQRYKALGWISVWQVINGRRGPQKGGQTYSAWPSRREDQTWENRPALTGNSFNAELQLGEKTFTQWSTWHKRALASKQNCLSCLLSFCPPKHISLSLLTIEAKTGRKSVAVATLLVHSVNVAMSKHKTMAIAQGGMLCRGVICSPIHFDSPDA